MKKFALTLACLTAAAATFNCQDVQAADPVRVTVRYGAFRGQPTTRRYSRTTHIHRGYPWVLPAVPTWAPIGHPSYVWRHGDHLHVEPATVYYPHAGHPHAGHPHAGHPHPGYPHPVHPHPVLPPVYRLYR